MQHLFGEAPSNRSASWHRPPDSRGSFNILSSCVVTLGLCIWSAVHLNIPKHDPSPKRRKWNPKGWIKAKHLHKAVWLIIGLLAPEMVSSGQCSLISYSRPILRFLLLRNKPEERVEDSDFLFLIITRYHT